MVDETTLPVSPGEASPAAPAPEEQGPIAPTKSYRLTPRAPGGTFLIQPAEPLREEEGPPIPPRGIGGGIADWIENQRQVASTVGYENPVVTTARSVADHWGLKRDDSYDPWPDIEGTEFAGNRNFMREAMFVGSRAELDLLKRRHLEEQQNDEIRSQNPVSTFVWGLLGAPYDPTNLLPGGAVYRSGRLGLGIARSAAEGAVAGAAGGLVSEMIAQNNLHTRTPQDLLTSTAMGAGFGGLIGIGGSVLGEVLGRSASQLSKTEFDRLAQNIEVGPRPVFDDVRRQLVDAGLPEEEAAANAAIWQARYAARAERRGLGESAFDLYRTERVDVQAGEAPEAMGGEQLGQFAGPSARTADAGKLATAEDMEKLGWDKDAVWMATGWGRGADGKWRFEIPDDLKGIGADVPDKLRAVPAGHGIRLRELYRNPNLEKAYPQVFDLPVATTSRGDGAFDEKAGVIWLNPEAPVEQVRLALIHEIQHAIQAEEGFARGSNSRIAGASAEAASGRMAGAAEKVQARVALLGESPESAAAFVAKHERLDADELARWAGKTPEELRAIHDENRPAEVYRRNAGEVEARNTEARSAMSGEERLSSPPWDTEDVPRERQIGREGDDRFYQSVPEQGFLGEAQGKVIDDTLSGVSKDKPALFPSTPKVFTALGVKDTPVVLPPSVIWKAVDKHHMTPAEIKGAVDALSNPVMVFDSATSAHSLVALVDVPGSTKSIVVALHHNEKVGRTEIARIASIHERASPGHILNWMAQGLTRYFNKWKAGAWVRSRGLQLPKDGSPRNRQGLRVLQHRDIFNSELKQSGEGAPRGAITMESNRALIELFRGRDQSTFMHESSHLWLTELIRDAEVSPAVKEDLDQVLAWFGVDDASKIGRAEHEKWAQGFEQYLRDGKAPSSALQRAFDQFKAWLTAIYKSLTDLGEPIPDEIRGVMDRMLAAEERPDSAGGLGASGGAAYRWEEGNRLKSSLGAAEVAGKTPIYGSPIAFVQTSPIAATRRAAEWIGDGRLSYAKNAEGVPTAADEAIGLRGNLDDVRRLARAKYAAYTRTLEDLYSQYRFGRHKRFGDNVLKMFPDQQHLDFADFKSEVFHAANMGDKHAIPEVAKAAGEFRKIADALADKAVEIGIWNEKPSPAGTLSYATHMFNTRLVGKRKQAFVADTQAFYAADQQAKARLQSRMQELAQQRDEMDVRQRKLQGRMDTVDRQEQELAARTKERGMETARAGKRADQLEGQATGAAEKATSLDEFVGAVKADLTSPQALAEIDDLRAQAREMSRLAKPRTQADITRAARFERDAVLSGVRLAAEIVIGRKRSYEPPFFLRWIARQGGVSDPNGTLKGSDIGLRGVVSEKGRSFDQLGERIAEEAGGLLPGRPGANEVEDWIVNAARGEEPSWWTARHLDAEHAGQSRVAQEIQQMAAERGVTLRTLDDVATFLRGEEGRPQTLEDLERRVAGEEHMRSEGMTGGAMAEEARQALEGALGERASARAAVRDAMVALAGVRRRMGRAETKAEEALRALTANTDRMDTLSDRAIDLSVRRQMLEAAMANHEAEAAALRGKMEEVVGAWNGNSSKGAKRALEKRQAAGEGMPGDAPRLRTADGSVDDAVEAILKARTDLTPDELRGRANETWQRVVGTPAGRFPYDDQAATGAAIRTGREELGRTFQGRTFAMPFETKAKWLETDIEHVARVMIEQMEMDMAIVQRFGSVTDMGGAKQISSDGTMVFREIADEAQRQMDQFAADYRAKNGKEPTAKEIEASNERTRKRADDDIRTLMKLLERQRGFFGMPNNPQGIEHQAARVARGFNILTSLGSVLISSMSDLATPLVRHGMIELLGNGWAPFVSSIGREVGGRAKEELRLMGVGLDLELNARMAAFSDVLDDYGRGSPLERAVGASVNKFMAMTMLPQWTDMGERVVGYTVMSKTLKAAQAATEGRLKPRQREMLADLGISEPMAARIWAAFSADNGGERFNGLWLTNTSAWQDLSAAEAMSIAVGRGVERSIVRPGMERPFWSQGNEAGRLVFQFQSFMTATAQTVTLAGIQQRDARAIMGFAAMIGLGAMSFAARQAIQGREVPTDPVKLVVEGLSTSGLLGWLDQVNTVAEKASGGHVGLSRLTGEMTSKHRNYGFWGTVGGPIAGKTEDVYDVSQNLWKGTASGYDVNKLRRSFLPGQNFWLLRGAIDNLEDGLTKSLGLKPRKRSLKVGAQ
ncbi:LPD23 domain-containing protein [Xanthobacter sp. 126]|uniref:MuF-C-terminal domain-containing protein n=1 Tax=Xanthobacter sp. 126 TaxID=1131814 RepID=UPI00045EB582|nr:LPD23 domain-containing protein [Xanthobacter sp. 126]